MSQKVALINPGNADRKMLGSYGKVEEPFAPLGLAYLTAVIRKAGHSVAVFDQFASKEPVSSLIAGLERFAPDVIGLSCLSPDVPDIEKILAPLKERLPDARIVLGNLHATIFHERFLQKRTVDFVIRGEGELAFSELIDRLDQGQSAEGIQGVSTREHPASTMAVPPDLDALPFPAWDCFNLTRYISPPLFLHRKILLPVQASRGCPYNCYFCCQNTMVPHLRRREPAHVVDEIEENLNRHHVDFFWFSDAIFPVAKKDGHQIADALIERGLDQKLHWGTECRVDSTDYELLCHLKKAGLTFVLYGFEVGDREILDWIKPGATLEAAYQVMKDTKQAGLLSLGLFMIGLPGETEQTINKTIRLALDLDPTYAKFNRAIPYPGSHFYEDVKETIVEEESYRLYNPWINDAAGDSLFTPTGLDNRRLVALQKMAMRRFYLRPKKVLWLLLSGQISLKNALLGARALLEGLFGRAT